MRFFNKVSLVVGAIALTATPVVASAAQSAQKLSVAKYSQARTAASTVDESELRGRAVDIFIVFLAATAIIAGILLLADGSKNTPTSP